MRGWENQSLTWEELLERFSSPTVTPETTEEYKAMSREKKTAVKDVGGFVGGYCTQGRRRVENILCRDLLTYDFDEFDSDRLRELEEGLAGYAWALYSTHSHTPDKWRVRVIIPATRSIEPDEFGAVSRKVASRIGMKGLDKGSFDLNRLMFWPSVSSDGEFLYRHGQGEFIHPEAVKAEYTDWRDAGEWPLAEDEEKADIFTRRGEAGAALRAFSRRGNGGRQEDPTEKKGLVGAFCRTYDIAGAIGKYLSHIYEPAPNGHYTHVGSSSCGSAKLLEGGNLIYSFHATDPLGCRMLNSWDLVRLALFRDKDEEAAEGTRTERLPSTKAMEALALGDPAVKSRYLREKSDDFEDLDIPEEEETENEEKPDAPREEEEDVMAMLDMQKGEVAVTAKNVSRILLHDKRLKGKIRLDVFSNNIEIIGKLPWKTQGKYWRNLDTDSLLTYFDKRYGMRKNTQIIERTFNDYLNNHAIHPVKEYLKGLPEWDGEKRLGRLFIDVLGAADTDLNRKLAELIFTAAVRRIEEPGAKFDYCVILFGPEGAYKSTLFSVMGGQWFSDSVSSIEGKDGKESIQGVWIAEISELTGLKKSEIATQKQFISSQEDRYRPAYGKITEVRPRQCVMVGTTNEEHFLKGVNDKNRRMPVVEINPALKKIEGSPRKWVAEHRDQLWAEAKELEKKKEPLFLGDAYEDEIREIQDRHNLDLDDPLFTALADYLEWWLPEGWELKSLEDRKDIIIHPYDKGDGVFQIKEKRNRVTIPEIMEECIGMSKNHPNYTMMSRKIGQYMKRFPGWRVAGILRGIYGCQKTWERVKVENPLSDSFVCSLPDPLLAL